MTVYLGNQNLLHRYKIGFMAGSKTQALSVLPTIDWAKTVRGKDDVSIVSGFHSSMEQEVLDILKNGACGIILVLARGIYKRLPERYSKFFDENRLLVISNEREDRIRADRYSCRKRNDYIAEISDEIIISSLSPNSSLLHFWENPKQTTIL